MHPRGVAADPAGGGGAVRVVPGDDPGGDHVGAALVDPLEGGGVGKLGTVSEEKKRRYYPGILK